MASTIWTRMQGARPVVFDRPVPFTKRIQGTSHLQNCKVLLRQRQCAKDKTGHPSRYPGAAWATQATDLPKAWTADTPDFELIKIPGNGSCMFQAIVQGHHYLQTGELLTEGDLYQEGYRLRREICYQLQENREDLEPFIPGSFEAYLVHMSQEGQWGGEPELAMAAKCIRRPILVYGISKSSFFGTSLTKTSEYGIDDYKGVAPVCVQFGNYHYDTLLVKG